MRAHQKMASHYTAHVHADMSAVAEVMHAPEGDPLWQSDATSAEIRAALVLTRRAADAELGFAVDLKERLVGVAEALLAGEIDIVGPRRSVTAPPMCRRRPHRKLWIRSSTMLRG